MKNLDIDSIKSKQIKKLENQGVVNQGITKEVLSKISNALGDLFQWVLNIYNHWNFYKKLILLKQKKIALQAELTIEEQNLMKSEKKTLTKSEHSRSSMSLNPDMFNPYKYSYRNKSHKKE